MRCIVVPLLLLGACSATGSIADVTPPSRPVSGFRSVRVNVAADEGHEALAPLVCAKLATRLQDSGLFDRVISSPLIREPADLVLRVRILGAHEVTTGGRLLLGGMAGQAEVRMEVELLAGRSEERIGSLVALGKSSGGTIFAGRTAEAAEQVADQVVAYLRAHD